MILAVDWYWWLRLAVTACVVYLLVNYALFFVFAIVGAIESAIRHLQSRSEDFDTVALSRFTIPVSVVVPAYNESPVICASVESLLELDYPELEIIVVNDGSHDDTLDKLRSRFALERQHVFYRRVLPTEPIVAVYKSRTHAALTVVDKTNGGKADALNCGLNFARYRYICTVDADAMFEPDALLESMRLVLRDPGAVVGLTSPIAVSNRPARWHDIDDGFKERDPGAFTSFQHFDFSRSFHNNRLAWSRFDFMLCTIGAFAVWRRDVLVDLGGFSRNFTCEDIEITFRVHEHFLRNKRRYRVLCVPDVVAVTEGPERIRDLVHQRARWQRVIHETLWHYRTMLFRPKFRSVAFVGLPYYIAFEVMTPFVEMLAFVSFPLAWYMGVLTWREFLLMVGCICLANGILTNWSLMLDDRRARRYSLRSHVAFIGIALADYVLYRPVIFVARWKGLVGFLRGDKQWHKFARNERAAGV